jgi:DNA-binding NarL/FixJ family response regulator
MHSQLANTLDTLLEAAPELHTPLRAFSSPPTRVSAREPDVLQLAEDRCNREIANQLYLSVCTIENHRRALLQKLKAHTLAELVAWPLRTDMVA